jgi:hypothetical protein
MLDIDINRKNFKAAESTFDYMTPIAITGRSIYRFNGSITDRIPMHVRTGQQSFGMPSERKKFTQVEFHGRGTVSVRVYIDGVYVASGTATMTESPSKDRRIGLPVGLRGYTIDLEFAGDADIRAVEYETKKMSGKS